MDYGKIISRSWNIVWSNKWLFILGFMAALGSGGGSGGSNFSTGSPGSGSGSGSGFPTNLEETLADLAPFLFVGLCFIILLAIALWLLRLIGEGGMIASVDRIEGGETLTFKDGFNAGKGHLKKMVGLSFILYGPFVVFGLIAAAGGMFTLFSSINGNGDGAWASLGALALCLVPLGCLLAILGLVVTFVYPMAQRSIIIKNMDIMDGIRDGWQVLKNNFGDIFVLGLIFFLIGLVFGFAALIVAVPVLLLAVVPIIIAAVEGGAVITAFSVTFAIIGFITFILITAAINAVLRALQSTGFTLAYHEWMGKKPVAVA